MLTSYQKGQLIEQLAAKYLSSKGIIILERNYRCKYGEIDLICEDLDCLIFVEVRYRKNTLYGSPTESITYKKQQKLIVTAKHYLVRHFIKTSCRIDVLALTGELDKIKIEWLQNVITW